MKNNKRFVGIVIAIVLGFLVVGGGGYYLINKEKVVEQNIGIEETTENNAELENPKEELIVKEVIDIKNKVVKLLAPNGDTAFNEGDKMKILWQGGGDSTMQIKLYRADGVITYDSPGNLYVDGKLSDPYVSIEEKTKNTGKYDWIIREDLPTGKYIVRIMCNFCAPDSLDFSDAPFVINSNLQTNWQKLATTKIDTTDWKTYSDDYSAFKYPRDFTYSIKEEYTRPDGLKLETLYLTQNGTQNYIQFGGSFGAHTFECQENGYPLTSVDADENGNLKTDTSIHCAPPSKIHDMFVFTQSTDPKFLAIFKEIVDSFETLYTP